MTNSRQTPQFRMRSSVNHRITATIALAAMAFSLPLVAQELQSLDEDFLLFLAEGMEVGGSWQDPMTLANITELNEISTDEIAWVAEQDISTLQGLSETEAAIEERNGEDND